MAVKIGIPRALFYYRFYPLWRTFFEELGAELVVSNPTTKRILDSGVKSCVDEACLPVKLFHGHVENIKSKVDYLFIPRLTSISRNEYICPKIGGLPDMIRNSVKNLPKIIDTEINLIRSEKNTMKAAYEIGEKLNTGRNEVRRAYKKALEAHKTYKALLQDGFLPDDIPDRQNQNTDISRRNLKIALIGHPYNIYDKYINLNMLKKLKGLNVEILTVDMLDERITAKKALALSKRMFWNFGSKAIGSVLHFIDIKDIDGIIYIMSFGCGVDSFVCDLVERRIRNSSSIPFMVVTLDEHSGEAGINTRLEAFVDMIGLRLKQSNRCTRTVPVIPVALEDIR